jgi:hypothetical protein
VKDASGASIAGAAVTAANASSGLKQGVKTDDQGVYSFPALAVGRYNIEVSVAGFAAYRQTGVVIDVNSALQVDVILQVAGQVSTVEVTEEAAQLQVEKSDTQMGETITSKRITEVPLNGRSYTDLLAIQAGVNPATTNVNGRGWRIWIDRAIRRTESW